MDFDLGKVLIVLLPALGAWGAAWLTNRRERRQWLEKQEEKQDRQLTQQADRLASGWSEMTTQAREIINRLQVETIDAKTRAAVAEDRADKLEKELAEVKSHFAMARAELDTLKAKRPARRREPAPEG